LHEIAADVVLIDGKPVPLNNPYSETSLIQPASIDLHVGMIHLPGRDEDAPGGSRKALTRHTLGQGETAVIITTETLRLPRAIGGIVFPPNSLAFQGLLITNPGHIDAGYYGTLRFAVINMARKEF
jgi:dCTP deaminase